MFVTTSEKLKFSYWRGFGVGLRMSNYFIDSKIPIHVFLVQNRSKKWVTRPNNFCFGIYLFLSFFTVWLFPFLWTRRLFFYSDSFIVTQQYNTNLRKLSCHGSFLITYNNFGWCLNWISYFFNKAKEIYSFSVDTRGNAFCLDWFI